ncbi:MAG: hypothetical protein ABI358_04170 [Ginsengibacter sp.]
MNFIFIYVVQELYIYSMSGKYKFHDNYKLYFVNYTNNGAKVSAWISLLFLANQRFLTSKNNLPIYFGGNSRILKGKMQAS